MPVIILSGSGNQGMTASLPVIKYAEAMSVSRERLYRALCISALVTVFQKVKIGRLSAFCGATSAGCGAAAGIAYLHGAGDEAIDRTIMNVLAILPGMVCDGAKPSCAAKIAMAVDAGILGYEVERGGQGFQDGDGLLGKGAEGTISNVGRLAVVGMRQTDQVILDIMTGTPRQ